MKNHTISIKNLGPIKEIKNFEVKKFNLLIGENASGKSLLAKAIWLFNDNFMWDFLLNAQMQHYSSGGEKSIHEAMVDYLHNRIDQSFNAYDGYELTYNYVNGLSLTIRKKAGKIFVELPSNVEEQIAKMMSNSAIVGMFEGLAENPKKAYAAAGQAVYQIYDILPTIFIPDIRSFISNFDAIRLNILDKDTLRQYADDVVVGDITLKSFAYTARDFIKDYKSLESAEHRRLMKGNVIKDGLNRLRFYPTANPKQEIPIEDVSSGQKDLFPILLVLQSIVKRGKPYFLIIEEIEAHNFPNLQKELLEEIIKCVNATDSKVLITTHSPLLLADANNLIEAHDKQYKKFIKKGQFIDAKQLNASRMVNGKCRSILDKRSSLIDGEDVEKASETLLDEFDQITMSK